jgi:hypothetical protein
MPSRHAAHERHDALLVSQLASGDPLDPWQLRDAELLVSSCRECASLAADLRALSRVVPWEPVAPRRRDFRITSADADRLRGSAFSRLLRRISLPETGTLRPAAFGALSIGLLFVVAGTVWPETGQSTAPATVTTPAGELTTPAGELTAPAAGMTTPTDVGAQAANPSPIVKAQADALEPLPAPEPDAVLLPSERSDESDGTRGLDPPAEVREVEAPEVVEAPAAADTPAAARQPAAADTLAAEQLAAEEAVADDQADGAARAAPEAAGRSPSAVSRSALEAAAEPVTELLQNLGAAATDALAYRDEVDAFDVAGKDQTAENGDASTARPGALDAFGIAGTASPAAESVVQAPPDPAASAAADTTREDVRAAQREATTLVTDQMVASPADEGITLGTILLVVGTVLAVGGVLLLLLQWLLRRSADPLLR